MQLDLLSDLELLSLIQKGNTQAYETIFNRHWESVYLKSFSILRDSKSSEDIVQDVFLRLWKNRKKIRILHFENYLHASVRNGSLKSLARNKLADRHLNTLSTLEFVSTTEEELNAKELESLIFSSLEELPDRCKEIFLLSRFENKSNSEIAKSLKISQRTVENQLYRAVKHLREILPYLLYLQISTQLY